MTILVLYLILKHFFFEKVHNFMVARENKIKEAFENAEQVNIVAHRKLESYEMKINDLEAEGREIIKKAKIKADIQAKSILDEAGQKAEEMIQKAANDIEREKEQAIAELRTQIIGLSLLAAEKVLEKKLDMAGQNDLIADILEKAGRNEWKS
jgi:F-type H+-transporting ATPase subunit b